MDKDSDPSPAVAALLLCLSFQLGLHHLVAGCHDPDLVTVQMLEIPSRSSFDLVLVSLFCQAKDCRNTAFCRLVMGGFLPNMGGISSAAS
jgi:hypothetical protein